MADEGQENLQEACPDEGDRPEVEDWVLTAWRAWCRGTQQWAELAKLTGKDWRTVRKHVEAFSKVCRVAEESGSIDALGEYIGHLREALTAAWHIYNKQSSNDNAKLGAIKQVSDLSEKIAAALGVVTERKATQHSGDGGGPIRIAFDIEDDGNSNRESE
jgi:hypothetical protein